MSVSMPLVKLDKEVTVKTVTLQTSYRLKSIVTLQIKEDDFQCITKHIMPLRNLSGCWRMSLRELTVILQ